MRELRHLAEQTIDVTFEDAPPELEPLDGVKVERAGANGLRLRVSGGVGPVIAALAAHPVLSLTTREPSLEEIFLHHYEGDGQHGPG